MKRIFLPGDTWLYYKVYCGARSSDILIETLLKPLIKDLFTEKLINKWFLIKYNDPDFHIRIRFSMTSAKSLKLIIQKMNITFEPNMNSLIHRIEISSYSRELERYGETSMELVEDLFHLDSERMVNLSTYKLDENQLLILACSFADMYFNKFLFSIEKRIELCYQQRTLFRKEFEITKTQNKSLLETYNIVKVDLSKMLSNKKISDKTVKLNKTWHNMFENTIQKLLEILKRGDQSVRPDSILTSLIHMSVNRLCSIQPRLFELLMYDSLYRFYNGIKYKNITIEKMENKGI